MRNVSRMLRPARRLRWPLVTLAVVAVALLVPAVAWAPTFIGGPSVRVNPNVSLDFKWTTDVSWNGVVYIFDNPAGTGQFVKAIPTLGPATTQEVNVAIGAAPLLPDTTLYFQVVATDPADPTSSIYSPQQGSQLPSFFTGTQALSNVQVTSGTTTTQISWQANVIGFGKVEYGTTTAYSQPPVTDAANVSDHSLTLTGLQPGTTYFYRLSNVHAIDGDPLASTTGSFTTLPLFADQFLPPLAQSTDPSSPVLNTGRNGKVIPVQVQINQGATALTNLNAPGPVTIAVSKLPSCSSVAGTDPVTTYADAGQSSAGTNQFNYNATAQAWVYNLDTKALGLVTGNCYRIDVAVNGTKITNAFAVFQPTK